MRNPALLYPMFALAAWTLLVLLLIPIARARSARRREIGIDDFKYGESPAVPAAVSIPNRNYMNLLELPMLFYVVCIVLYVSAGASTLAIALAWAFVVLRIVHSVIHLSYNRVVHRLAAFSAANIALLWLWLIAGTHLAAAAP
ncbi:MAG TPA: MAPEG family protein [Caldimonas sp.]|jgi:hypothetical protein|nr:MAPEG family protein [Caldimonas sp.]HEV7577560.1 MAPEG family protein [Caldimonas sp.]